MHGLQHMPHDIVNVMIGATNFLLLALNCFKESRW